MTLDGGPEPPDDGYPDPDKYTPDNLGEKKVWESRGRIYVMVPSSALRLIGAEDDDVVKFTEQDDGSVRLELIEK
jgi:hypothetical protein